MAPNRPRTHCNPSPIGDLSTGRRTPEPRPRHPRDSRRALGGLPNMRHHAFFHGSILAFTRRGMTDGPRSCPSGAPAVRVHGVVPHYFPDLPHRGDGLTRTVHSVMTRH